jgi:hypothetical protein
MLAAVTAVKHNVFAGAAVLLPALAAGGLGLLARPEWLVWLTVLPSTANDHLGLNIGGLNLRMYNVLALAGLGWLSLNIAARLRVHARYIAARHFILFLPLLLFAGSKMMSVVTMSEFPLGMTQIFSAKYVVFSVLLLLTAYVTLFMIDSRRLLEQLLRGWIHMANIVWLIAILQLLLSNILHFHLVHHREVIWFGRPYSVFREPDVLGSFVGATVLMVLPMLVWRSRLLPRRYLWATLAVHGMLLLILFVRAAWIGTLVGLVLWSVSALRLHRLKPVVSYFNRSMVAVLVTAALLPIFMPDFVQTLAGRFASLGDPTKESASEYRIRDLSTMVTQTLPDRLDPQAVERFLFGHGDFSWSYWAPYLLGENYDRSAVELMQAGHGVLVHPGFCMTLSIFFDNGAAGLTFFLIFYAMFFRRYFGALEQLQGGDAEDQVLVVSTFLPIVCVLVCFQFSYDPISPFLWVLIGLHCSAVYFTTLFRPSAEFEPMRQLAVQLGIVKNKGACHDTTV